MTSIKLTVTGASARAVVNGPLTSGMVGIPITIEYDDTWDGLIKNLICKSEPKSCSLVNTTRTIVNIGTTATVAHEVMRADRVLYLGVEGKNADGETVISTTWAECGEICFGATGDADPSADPTLQIWAQVQAELEQVKKQAVTETQVSTIISDYLGENLPAQNTALTEQQINALDGMFKVCAFIKEDVSAEYAVFQNTFGITDSGGEEEPDEPVNPGVTLSSISASYSGGGVSVGTALNDLTGLVVTAHYSDGSQQNVTGYTLSGEIAEGENTITVIYQGMTATFTVTGAAAPEAEWVSNVKIDLTGKILATRLNESTGAESDSTTHSSTDYINCYGAYYAYYVVASGYIHFYDVDRNWLSGNYGACTVPANAVYFRICAKTEYLTDTSDVRLLEKPIENATLGEAQAVTWTSGAIGADGAISDSSGNKVSDFIPIGGASSADCGTVSYAAFYDNNQKFIIRTQNMNMSTLPVYATYVRCQTYTDSTFDTIILS